MGEFFIKSVHKRSADALFLIIFMHHNDGKIGCREVISIGKCFQYADGFFADFGGSEVVAVSKYIIEIGRAHV